MTYTDWPRPSTPRRLAYGTASTRRFRPTLEPLEDRLAPAGINLFTVTNTDDSGAGSLRQAMLDANDTPNDSAGPDRITFAINGASPYTIALTSALPVITDPLVIDGERLAEQAAHRVHDHAPAGGGRDVGHGLDGVQQSRGGLVMDERDVADVRPFAQMPDQPPERGRFKLGAGLVFHGVDASLPLALI